MMKKQGSISIVLMVALLAVMGGTVMINMAIKSKAEGKLAYLRIADQYISESGVDLSVGLFLNYLENQKYELSYKRNEDGSYTLIEKDSPYVLSEIEKNENSSSIPLLTVSDESNSYMSSIGFLDFGKNKNIEFSLLNSSPKESYKISNLSNDSEFSFNSTYENSSKMSKLNPIDLSVKSFYHGAEVLCTVELTDLEISREPFKEISVGELSSVSAKLDTTSCHVNYKHYQNNRRFGK